MKRIRKEGQKLSVIEKELVNQFFVDGKKVLLYKSMIKSQFNYCPLVWMYCSRPSNKLINRVHERGPRLTLRNETNKEFQQI